MTDQSTQMLLKNQTVYVPDIEEYGDTHHEGLDHLLQIIPDEAYHVGYDCSLAQGLSMMRGTSDPGCVSQPLRTSTLPPAHRSRHCSEPTAATNLALCPIHHNNTLALNDWPGNLADMQPGSNQNLELDASVDIDIAMPNINLPTIPALLTGQDSYVAQEPDFSRFRDPPRDNHGRISDLLDAYPQSTTTALPDMLSFASHVPGDTSHQLSSPRNFNEVDSNMLCLESDVSSFPFPCHGEEFPPPFVSVSLARENGLPILSSNGARAFVCSDVRLSEDTCCFPSSFPMSSIIDINEHENAVSQSFRNHLPATSTGDSRLSRRSQEQIAHGSRPIAPKLLDNENATSHLDSQLISITSADGITKTVAAIAKAPYSRPVWPKKLCQYCDDFPEGFRSDHELRRHVDRAHTVYRRMWITRDASDSGNFLANCKACRTGKKYGAYYNAVAHLRRVHFNPCKRGRGRGRSGEERRGGKGGGDHPPMDELKRKWIEEVQEYVPENFKEMHANGDAETIGSGELSPASDAQSPAPLHQTPLPSPVNIYTYPGVTAPESPRRTPRVLSNIDQAMYNSFNSAYDDFDSPIPHEVACAANIEYTSPSISDTHMTEEPFS